MGPIPTALIRMECILIIVLKRQTDVQLLIDKGEFQKAKDLLLSTWFQKVHQTYTRTGLWKQITDKMTLHFVPFLLHWAKSDWPILELTGSTNSMQDSTRVFITIHNTKLLRPIFHYYAIQKLAAVGYQVLFCKRRFVFVSTLLLRRRERPY